MRKTGPLLNNAVRQELQQPVHSKARDCDMLIAASGTPPNSILNEALRSAPWTRPVASAPMGGHFEGLGGFELTTFRVGLHRSYQSHNRPVWGGRSSSRRHKGA